MRKRLSLRCVAAIALGALLVATIAPRAVSAQSAQQLVLNNVTIVNTRDGSLQRDMTIVIEGGKIAKIAPAGSLPLNRSAKNVDARGEFVVPGFNDMHVHSLQAKDAADEMTVMLANGITGYRQMSGSPELLEARREGKLAPTLDAPELLAMPGTIITHVNAATPEMAVAEVDRQQAAGADFIKVIEAGPAVFFAVAKEANKLGIPYLGHLNETVNVVDAANAGMRSIEHLGPTASILIGCSTDEAAIRATIAQAPAQPPAPGIPDLAERATADPMLFAPALEFTIVQRVMDTYDEAKCRKLAALFVTDKTWQVPTLIRIRTMQINDDPDYASDPNLKYEPPATRKMWADVTKMFPQRLTSADREELAHFFTMQLRLTKLLADSGVSMMAGSDSGLSASYDIPGFALHQEFDLLRDAGLPPLKILQMTTLDPARYLGREATMGTVEAGKNADLVVLDGNPALSAQNLHEITGVVRGGAYYSRAALDAMLQKAANRIGQQKMP